MDDALEGYDVKVEYISRDKRGRPSNKIIRWVPFCGHIYYCEVGGRVISPWDASHKTKAAAKEHAIRFHGLGVYQERIERGERVERLIPTTRGERCAEIGAEKRRIREEARARREKRRQAKQGQRAGKYLRPKLVASA